MARRQIQQPQETRSRRPHARSQVGAPPTPSTSSGPRCSPHSPAQREHRCRRCWPPMTPSGAAALSTPRRRLALGRTAGLGQGLGRTDRVRRGSVTLPIRRDYAIVSPSDEYPPSSRSGDDEPTRSSGGSIDRVTLARRRPRVCEDRARADVGVSLRRHLAQTVCRSSRNIAAFGGPRSLLGQLRCCDERERPPASNRTAFVDAHTTVHVRRSTRLSRAAD